MRYQKISTRKLVRTEPRNKYDTFRAQCAGCEQWKACRNINNAPLCVEMCAAGRSA